MQRKLRVIFGIESEIQLPTTEPQTMQREFNGHAPGSLVILFAGSITYAVEDSLTLLAELVCSGIFKQPGMPEVSLHVYTKISDNLRWCAQWSHPDLLIKDWLPQSELRIALARADILFLPYSFLESSRHAVQTAFPSKTADYLATGKPVLVFGPSYSSLVCYATEQGFGEVVTEFNAQALAAAIRTLALSPSYRTALGMRALQTFSSHHDIHEQRRKFLTTVESVSRRAPSSNWNNRHQTDTRDRHPLSMK
jgi:glycosyltransferase involved in cell wall biosynthesis